MGTVILLRHGRTTANASGILAGRSPGVELDDHGRAQAEAAGARLACVPLAAIITSPLVRCRQTARPVLAAQTAAGRNPETGTDQGINECDYGDWAGRALKELAREPLWRVVQSHASAAVFPGGESMRAMQTRGLEAVRRRDAELTAAHGAQVVWVAVTHGDMIKGILADAMGMHLDAFQRLQVDPASMSVVRYDPTRPSVLGTNLHDEDLSWLAPKRRGRRRAAPRETVGGGAGPA